MLLWVRGLFPFSGLSHHMKYFMSIVSKIERCKRIAKQILFYRGLCVGHI